MADKKTTGYLDSMGWYRFLKVVYILLALMSFGWLNLAIWANGEPFISFLIFNAVMIAIFEGIRRAFYYIVLGTVSPKK